MFLSLFFLAIVLLRANATVVITTPTNQSMPFSDMEAGFAPRVPQAGILGLLYRGNPLDACDPLKTGPALDQSPFSSFVLVKRGACRFETKVRNAQDAGFSAVIVYNDEDGRDLVINVILSYFFFAVSGDSYGIKIPAVFVSHAAGKVLWRYAGNPQTRCFIFPTLDYPAWSVMAVAFISLLAVTAVLATFFFVRRHRLRRLGSRLLLPREPPGLTSSEVRSLPTFVYRRAGDGDDQADTCVICMEEYEDGQKLRVLPCRHAFQGSPFVPFARGMRTQSRKLPQPRRALHFSQRELLRRWRCRRKLPRRRSFITRDLPFRFQLQLLHQTLFYSGARR
ncbi:receptor homology region, transmembrane domain- and RING domain-containing protein 2 isoform X3 [Selaginella moellendorffii]|uniref:receptor homology region, transmembrane domain- and RING domain-containing protein 2 isoform X3 n=1 Tax=Selaginella moellendorffii TaxID=88036 RepID=UPI000D1CEDC0|nr:receptor homology region, transmembrane domain- and RING domain-containing protein 2 isoform X3 [Selaginella moellendorffii]|eukprot:XP_024533121.1 receptor homology region, transmembrane domain- and RING domain-containing protein 2 isoform X3 [Selaginella moellendorffii]